MPFKSIFFKSPAAPHASRFRIVTLLLFIMTALIASNLPGQILTHEMSEEEKALMPAYLEKAALQAQTPPPTAPVRNIAEFEPMEGVLIAYPFGIPVSLIAEMSEDVMVTTIVAGQSEENSVRSTYSANGVNLSNCNFLHAPHDSYWTRDYGPWFVTGGNGALGIVDFTYNRPRPNDNAIPSEMATFLNLNLYQMDLVQAGGNYMTDGTGISAATDLVWDENGSYTHAQVDQIVNDYLGIQTYHVTADPTGTYIKHIDCWAKYLDVDKILIARVPSGNSNYSDYENVASYFSNQTSGYGNNYQVYRVDTPSSQPYTNSLILNNKVLVPITGSGDDSDALADYENAMPGYEVIGVSGSWSSTDALHCRVIGIADREMLYIDHLPLLGEKPEQPGGYDITAGIIPYSGYPVQSNSVKIYYKVNGGSYSSITMSNTGGDTYTGTIPAQTAGSGVAYYIVAADTSAKTNKHPFIGASDPHVFTVAAAAGAPVAQFTAAPTTIPLGGSVQFTDQSTDNPTSWSWTFEGGTPASSTAQNPTVTYNTLGTYSVSLTVSNANGSDTETKTAYIIVPSQTITYCSSSSNDSSYEWIAGVQVGGLNNTSGASNYTDFTSLTASLTAGASTSVSLTPGFSSSSYGEYWKIWIDYNSDGDFEDPGENVFSGSGQSTVTGSFTVPTSASGTTRMRVAMKYGSSPSPCETFSYGEVEDYTVTVDGAVPQPPVADFSASATVILIGESVSFTDLSTNSPTSWTWTFSGAAPSSSTQQHPVVTYNTEGTYTVSLTAVNAVGSDTETKTGYITVTHATIEYCASSGNNQSYEWIAGVQVGGLNNTSGASASGYTDFTSQTANLTAGGTVNVSLTPGFSSGSYSEYWRIWIDYNGDGDFDDTGEQVFSGSGQSTVTGSFTVPSSASGTVRMRVSMKYNSYPTPCETFSYGEVEDYTAVIQ